ncbi:SGNH/GDSL hydrolase family protein [Nocardioides sp. LHG3406-4]|uniref:SGNH/GDSL hydrolase family protein n=1 Tax=Nocardioides sp. LHG3406-4 TaxID=2804575 RepID=UPI003CF4AD1F
MRRLDRRALAVLASAGLVATSSVGARQFLQRQAAIARGIIGDPLGHAAPEADKVYRKSRDGRLELLMLGDSIAAGLGAERPKDTLGARLARGLGKAANTSVRLCTAARVGSESSLLAAQLDALPGGYRPDVAVIVVGGNDVTHRVPVGESVRHLTDAVDRLHELGARVVVGTCPDLGALRPVPQPLRSLGSRASRQLAAAQRRAALDRGAYVVSLAHVVGPFFITNPDEMFSLDRFHPSAAGYRRTAKAMLPSVLRALGHADELPFGHHAPPAGP